MVVDGRITRETLRVQNSRDAMQFGKANTDFRGLSVCLTSGKLATRPAIGPISPGCGVPLALGHLQAKVAHLSSGAANVQRGVVKIRVGRVPGKGCQQQ